MSPVARASSDHPASEAAGVRLHWTNLVFIAIAHVLAVCAILYLVLVHFSWWTVGFGFVWALFCGLSVTGGYHRLFSHGAYTASAPLRALYLFFGSASVQNSALAWSADHRAHHAFTDRRGDPYSVKDGFWWAHIGWILVCSGQGRDYAFVRDLARDPLVRWQHRYYVPLAVVAGGVVPLLAGMAWGDPLGTLLVAGWLRLVLQWHATFSVNSFAHVFGRRTYGRESSARDSFWVALLTFGEGYHSFHHRFQGDYRNGVRWFQFDPTKWWVWTAAKLGLAGGLRRVPRQRELAARSAVRTSRP